MKTLVPVSDEIKSQIISRVHEGFTLRNGMTPVNDTFPETKKAYIIASRPDQRISVGWTLDQIQITEARRIADFIKSKDPMWTNGKPINPDILQDALKTTGLNKKI